MKKTFLLFAGALAALVIVACSKDEVEPEPTPEPGTEYDDVYYAEHASISSNDSRFTATDNGAEVHFKAEGGEVQVLVSCGTEWVVDNSNTAAFSVEIIDAQYVTITAEQNLDDEGITGTVTLATAEMNIVFASIALVQDGLGHITLSAEELSFPRTGGEMSVNVESEYDWECECDDDWFTAVADIGTGTLTVTCDVNGTGVIREGTVTVTAGDNSNNATGATLKITQEDIEVAAFVLEYTVTSDGTTIQLPLGGKDHYNNEFAIDCTVDWGDGSEAETVNDSWPSHTYSSGTYTVIINGKAELLCSYDYGGSASINGVRSLTAVQQWGDLGLKSMDFAFYGCTNLTSLPEEAGPFSKVVNFNYAFSSCRSLSTVPENLFADCASAEIFSCLFYGCESLTAVPEGIFSGCTSAVNFSFAFCDCENLISAPSFKGLSKVTNFESAFDTCESLTTVPENLFSGCAGVMYMGYAFYRCTSLSTVPENLFADCPLVEDFEGVFWNCTCLETVPVGIFDNNKSVLDFESAFYKCSSLVGESPYTMMDGNKVHLYERENYPDNFSEPIDYEDCFGGCTKLDDYDDIPSDWK